MDERMRFVARLMEGEKMAVLCRGFEISRKTGYKIFYRHDHSGIEGLTDRSRRPPRANALQHHRPPRACELPAQTCARQSVVWVAPMRANAQTTHSVRPNVRGAAKGERRCEQERLRVRQSNCPSQLQAFLVLTNSVAAACQKTERR